VAYYYTVRERFNAQPGSLDFPPFSTWHSNEFRTNPLIGQNWSEQRFHILTREHFYHVGSTEDLRHPMIEALITNFPAHAAQEASVETEQMAFFERPLSEFSTSRQSAAH
jgi:hypothetical protein